MRKRIYLSLCGISIFAVLITSVFILWRVYGFYTQQVQIELQDQCMALADEVENRMPGQAPEDFLKSKHALKGVRITLVKSDGQVTFDSEMRTENLKNHLDRPEIQSAMSEGEGTAIRYSNTTGADTYYHAIRLSDGEVIRVSKQTRSIRQVFYNAIPIVLGAVILLFFFCIWVAFLLTKRLIAPIEKMSHNLDDMSTWEYDDELSPFVQKIAVQQKEIQNRITEQKRLENIRKEFTSNVSHELKTPLTSISGYAEMIETGIAAPEDVRHFSQKIIKEAARLVNLIDDIIRLSRIETEQEKSADKEQVNLYEVCQNVFNSLRFTADAAHIDLRVFGNPNMTMEANSVMLEEMIFNLCDNGVKYNHEGGRVYIVLTKESDIISICVKDTGIGILPEHHQRIFERFYRVDKSRSKQSGGTGLGLSIVKHIVEFHKGELKIESTPGEGTAVTVLLPEKEMP